MVRGRSPSQSNVNSISAPSAADADNKSRRSGSIPSVVRKIRSRANSVDAPRLVAPPTQGSTRHTPSSARTRGLKAPGVAAEAVRTRSSSQIELRASPATRGTSPVSRQTRVTSSRPTMPQTPSFMKYVQRISTCFISFIRLKQQFCILRNI